MWNGFQIIAYDHGPSVENVDFINCLTSCFHSAGEIFADFQFQYAMFNLDSIGHVRYINILTWLRGFQVNFLYLALFSLYPSLFWELKDKRNLKNLQF